MRNKKLVLWLLPLVILSMAQCRQETIEAYYEADNQILECGIHIVSIASYIFIKFYLSAILMARQKRFLSLGMSS